MTDYSELKRLAEAAKDNPDSPYIPCQVAFNDAANPAAVLALIAENERLTSQWGDRPAYRTAEYESKRDAMWRRAHMVAASKGYDHINMAIAAAPTACVDCMGCGGEWQGEGLPNSVCEFCQGSRGKSLEAERDQLKAEVEALRRDAERYRWITDGSRGDWCWSNVLSEEHRELSDSLDGAVDAAMSKESGHD